MKAIVTYCGGGGSTKGLHDAGYESVGVDYWLPACRTHAAAGFPTIRADLNTYPWRPVPDLDLLWASPPCQAWSTAGRKLGTADARNGWPATVASVEVLRPRLFIAENVTGMTNRRNRPYLEAILAELRALGYDVAARVLVASDYGVPQARARLFIVARLDASPVWPAGTHAAYRPRHHSMDRQGIRQPELFGEEWVPAAVVFGDGTIDRRMGNAPTTTTTTTTPSPTLTGSAFGKGQWVVRTGNNTRVKSGEFADWRDRHAPQERPIEHPSPTVDGKAPSAWTIRPATTILGDPRVSEPGHHDPTVGNSQHTGAKWTMAAAATLQGFPPDWPWQGTRTEIHQQIGNAVVPIVAQRLAEVNRP